MTFKKSLAAVVFALPFVLGTDLFFIEKIDALIIVAGSPAKRSCNFLESIIKDLTKNLFDNGECGDAVSLLSPYYDYLSKYYKGSWCSASRLPRCHRNFSNLRVITSTLILSQAALLMSG